MSFETFVKPGHVNSHQCKALSTHSIWGNTTEMWEKLDTKFWRSFYILHHFAHIDSSYRSRCMLFCHKILLMFMIFVVIFVIKLSLFLWECWMLNVWRKQIIYSLWYSKFMLNQVLYELDLTKKRNTYQVTDQELKIMPQ